MVCGSSDIGDISTLRQHTIIFHLYDIQYTYNTYYIIHRRRYPHSLWLRSGGLYSSWRLRRECRLVALPASRTIIRHLCVLSLLVSTLYYYPQLIYFMCLYFYILLYFCICVHLYVSIVLYMLLASEFNPPLSHPRHSPAPTRASTCWTCPPPTPLQQRWKTGCS